MLHVFVKENCCFAHISQVCYLLETDTSATGKFFAERHEIDWVDAAF